MKKLIISQLALVAMVVVSFNNSLHAKKLQSPQVALLNVALVGVPLVTCRLKLAYAKVNDLSKKLENDVASFSNNTTMVSEQIDMMLGPVKEFFGEVVAHKDMIVPLIQESLKDHESAHKGKSLADVSYLNAFFNENAKDIIIFFKSRITDQAELKQASEELRIFLGDLFDSLSQGVIQAYEKLMKDIQAKKTGGKGI